MKKIRITQFSMYSSANKYLQKVDAANVRSVDFLMDKTDNLLTFIVEEYEV